MVPAAAAASFVLLSVVLFGAPPSRIGSDTQSPGAVQSVSASRAHTPMIVLLPISVVDLPPAVGFPLAQLASDELARAVAGAIREPFPDAPGDPSTVARRVHAAVVVSSSLSRTASGWRARAEVWHATGEPLRAIEADAASLAEVPLTLARAVAPAVGGPKEWLTAKAAVRDGQPGDAWFERFLVALASGAKATDGRNVVGALEQLDRECEGQPDLLVRLGQAYLDRAGRMRGGGRPLYDAADTVLRRVLELDAAHPRGLETLAAVFAKIGRAEESAALLKKALDRYPQSASFWSALGYSLRYAGLLDRSVAAYRRALALDGRPENVIEAEGQIAKGLVQLGQYDDAAAAQTAVLRSTAALGKAPDEKMLFYDGLIELYRGRNERANERFSASRVAARTLWSDFAEAYRLATSGDTASALVIARRLESEDIVDGERRYRLVQLFALSGDRSAAVRHLAGAIEAGFFNAPYFSTDPLTASLRGEAGYASALEAAWSRHRTFKATFE
jgi:tetratricopeptide (TPR) repeat protein